MQTHNIPKIDKTQIDDYQLDDQLKYPQVLEKVGQEAHFKLYNGIENYRASYKKNIIQYHKKKFAGQKIDASPYVDQARRYTYFRTMFANYLQEKIINKNGNEFNKDKNLRVTDPKKCTVSISDFLGAEGEKLYHLALEEEIYSLNYIHAVLENSITEYPGKKWLEKLVVLVGGPSGSGKSYAAKHVINHADTFIKKDHQHDDTINYTITEDGENLRKISQMRKLLIQVANYKGYTGIQDLHDQSKILELPKKRMLEFVLHKKNPHGVIIPETFSTYGLPIYGRDSEALLTTIGNYPDVKIIFSQVKGENPAEFKKIVEWMGNLRAWKTDWENKIEKFDLNLTDIRESKAYNAAGFEWGKSGSEKAAIDFYKQHAGKCVLMSVINDLVLVPEGGNTVMVSKRILDEFLVEKTQNPALLLSEFKNRPKYQTFAPVIVTSALSMLNQVENQFLIHYTMINKKMIQTENDQLDNECLKCLMFLNMIEEIKANLNNPEGQNLIDNTPLVGDKVLAHKINYSKQFIDCISALQNALKELKIEFLKRGHFSDVKNDVQYHSSQGTTLFSSVNKDVEIFPPLPSLSRSKEK